MVITIEVTYNDKGLLRHRVEDIVREAEEPLTKKEIHERLGDVSMNSLKRTLARLKDSEGNPHVENRKATYYYKWM